MPKLKTHKGTAKRIKKTGSGKLMRRHSYKGHFLSKKSAARKRQFGKDYQVSPGEVKSIKRNLGEK